MDDLFDNSVLEELYQHRNEEVSHHFIKNSKAWYVNCLYSSGI